MTKYNINMVDLEKRGGSFWGYTDKRIALRYEEPFPEQKMTFSGVPVSAFGFDSKPGSELIKDFLKSQFAIL